MVEIAISVFVSDTLRKIVQDNILFFHDIHSPYCLSLLHVSVVQGRYTSRSNSTQTRPLFQELVPLVSDSKKIVVSHSLRVSNNTLRALLH